MNRPVVAVIGGAKCTANEEMQAAMIGRLLAEQDVMIVCGGRGGVMEAVCGGARAGGGLTVGILPGAHADEANPYVDIPIVTGMGQARNVIIIRSAQAVIAIGGGYGTLSEIALALKHGIPVVSLGSWKAQDAQGKPLPLERVGSAEAAVKAVMRSLDAL